MIVNYDHKTFIVQATGGNSYSSLKLECFITVNKTRQLIPGIDTEIFLVMEFG